MAVLPDAVHTRGLAALDASLAASQQLGLATVAHLSRDRDTSREHTESDLRVFIGWCQDRSVNPGRLAARILERWSRLFLL
jgi:hypothetical protein